jgi:hypothetical protein
VCVCVFRSSLRFFCTTRTLCFSEAVNRRQPYHKCKAETHIKGLEPKLHDLALSMGENKTLNLKDKTSLKRFTRYRAIDIHIKFCVGNNSSVTI